MQQTQFTDNILNNIRNIQEIKDNLLDYTTQMNDEESNKRLEELQERIDVMKETRVEQVIRKDKKIHRNDPCPCGSGKKYKKCCGKNK